MAKTMTGKDFYKNRRDAGEVEIGYERFIERLGEFYKENPDTEAVSKAGNNFIVFPQYTDQLTPLVKSLRAQRRHYGPETEVSNEAEADTASDPFDEAISHTDL